MYYEGQHNGPPRLRMNTTSVSLLQRLHQLGDQDAWQRFVHLYTPLLYYWARRVGLPEADAADLVQEVLLVVVQKMPDFAYDPGRSFRGWLRTVALNKWRERCRRHAAAPPIAEDESLSGLPGPDGSDAFDEAEYRQQLVRRALVIMKAEFEPTTWKACWEFVVSGRAAAAVAAELSVSVEVVYGAKSRVLRRLRQELDGLLD
jgi:RNA polymerase sigma-70 factor, ECF subfamily